MRARWTSRIGARSRVLVVGTVALALLVPGAAVAAGPADAAPSPSPSLPPGALPVVDPVPIPARVRALVDRLPPIVPSQVADDIYRAASFEASDSGVVIGTGYGRGDFQAFRVVDGVQTYFPATTGIVSEAMGVNEKGQVAVRAWFEWEAPNGPYPYLWHPDGTVEALPYPDEKGEVWGIDDAGRVVGSASVRSSSTPWGYETRAVLWEDGQMRELEVGGPGTARHINGRGVAVGTRSGTTGTEGWMWRDGTVTPLEVPAGLQTADVRHVSDRGNVLGSVYVPGPGGPRGAVWWGGTELRYVAGEGGWLSGVNDRGTAVGRVHRASDAADQPVVVDRHRATRLWTRDGRGGAALSINDLGIVAGYEEQRFRTDAAVWVLGVQIPLGAPAGWDVQSSAATYVDPRGRVLGWMEVRDGTDWQTRGVVWDLLPTAQQIERWLR